MSSQREQMIGSTNGSGAGPADVAQDALFEQAERLLPGGLLGRQGLPEDARFAAQRGAGARIYDLEGRAYVDYLAGAGALILGHCHPEVVRAVTRQVESGSIFFSILHQPALDLAEEIISAVACAEKLIFTTTGSEATLYAMRFARAYTKRDRVLKFEGGYHGNHDFALMNTAAPTLTNYPQARADYAGVAEVVADTALIAPYNDLEITEQIVREHRADLAAIIVDPCQRGGVFPDPDFLPGLRRIATENDILLIFDEVITGFRLAYGGAQEYFGVIPDLASIGKIVGGGLALGAVVGRSEIMDLADATRRDADEYVMINGTMHATPLAAAAGLATLKELRKPGTYQRLNAWTGDLRDEVAKILRRHSLPALVVNEGSIWHIVFGDKPHRNHADTLATDNASLKKFDKILLRNGIFLLPGGRRMVTCAHGAAELEDTLKAVDTAARAMA